MNGCSPDMKRKTLFVFDDKIADMLTNKKINRVVAEFFIRVRKLNICNVFISQSYFAVPKNIRQIAFNHSSDIDFEDFMNLQNHILF